MSRKKPQPTLDDVGDVKISELDPAVLARMAASQLGRMGGVVGGRSTSEAKAEAARLNGLKGGRPSKRKIAARKARAARAKGGRPRKTKP